MVPFSKKLVSGLLIVSLLCPLLENCAPQKIITYESMVKQEQLSPYVILHTRQKKYILRYFRFNKDALVGELGKFKSRTGYYLHVYTNLDMNLLPDKDETYTLTIKKEDIERMEMVDTIISTPGIIGIAAGMGAGALIIYGVFKFTNDTIDYIFEL
jgi:hypothetical protein